MSEEIVVKAESAPVRSLEIIGSEIETLKSGARNMIAACEAYTKQSCFEIGKRLLEAKNNVAHGEYLPWLETVGYSEQSANNLIRIYTEMGNDDAFSKLSYSQMIELLPLSSEQRKEVLPDVEDKSRREIKRLVAELKAAEKAKEEAEQGRKDAEELLENRDKEIARLSKQNADYFAAKTTAEGDLKKLKSESAEKIKTAATLLLESKETEKELAARVAELEKQLKNKEKRELTEAEMNAIYKQAEKEVAAKQARAEALSDPHLVELNVRLKELQSTVIHISELLGDLAPDAQKDMLPKVAGLIRASLINCGIFEE